MFLIGLGWLNIFLIRLHLSLLLHRLFLHLLLHSWRFLRNSSRVDNQQALIIDFAHILGEQFDNIIPKLQVGKTFIVIVGGKFMEIVLLKEGSNELDMLTVFKCVGKFEEFKETLVEGLRVHLVKLVPL